MRGSTLLRAIEVLKSGPADSPAIAKATGMDPRLVNISLRFAERKGYVERVGRKSYPMGRPATVYQLVDRLTLAIARARQFLEAHGYRVTEPVPPADASHARAFAAAEAGR